MIDLKRVMTQNEACPVREVGSGIVIMAPEGEMTHSLDDIGAFIWSRFDGKNSLQDILDALLSEYDVTEEQARKDLEDFVDQLQEAELLVNA